MSGEYLVRHDVNWKGSKGEEDSEEEEGGVSSSGIGMVALTCLLGGCRHSDFSHTSLSHFPDVSLKFSILPPKAYMKMFCCSAS